MKNKYFLFAAIILVAFSPGDDVLKKVGTDSQAMKERVCQNINNSFSLSAVVYCLSTKACKALPVAERAAVVNAVGELVKAYINSEAFSKDYESYVRNQYADYEKPDANDPKWKQKEETYSAEIIESQKALEKLGYGDNYKADIDMQIGMYTSLLASVNDESMAEIFRQQGYTEENLNAKIGELEKIQALYNDNKKEESLNKYARFSAHEKVLAEIVNQSNRYDEMQKEMQEKLALDKTQKVKAALQEFLLISADIDFNAQLLPKNQYGIQQFANPVYEKEKSREWKILFRAGKEPVMAARTFAQNWLKELN